jgi:hypothetical protein
MKAALFLVMSIYTVLLFHSAYAIVPMGSLVVTCKPERSIIESNEVPILVGTVTNQAGKPVENANVSISTSIGVFETVTDGSGKFQYQYPNTVMPAQYLVNFKAQKEGYKVGLASTTFFVSGLPGPSPKTVFGNIKNNDPIASKILKNMETEQKLQIQQNAKIAQIKEEKKFQESQRALANQQLQIDLSSWFLQFNPSTPRNAYAEFVSQINQTIQSIFWGQFNFTENKTNKGLSAMNQTLQNGGSIEDARNAFIQNASSSRSDIVQVNKDQNIKYGHADKDVQAKFDKYGNIPRS